MTFLRVVLSIFAILNVVFWALLAWVWAVKPSWASRIPLNLGTDERFKTSVPVRTLVAAGVPLLRPVSAVLYLRLEAVDCLAFIGPVALASIFLIVAIAAAAGV